MLFGEAVDAVLNELGFDQSRTNTSRATVGRWVDRAHKEMVRKSKLLRETVELGPTVADQGAYDVPASVVEIDALTVGGVPLDRKGRRQLSRLVGGVDRILLGFTQGFYVPTFTSAGVGQVTVYPTPTLAGESIAADCVLFPSTLVSPTDDTEALLPPDEFCEAIVDKAGSIGIGRVSGNPFLAQDGRDQFDQKTEELRRLVGSQVGGTEPTYLRVAR